MSRVLDSIYLGCFLGLAEAAEELRDKQTDRHFVDSLIAFRKKYREQEAAEQLQGDSVSNLAERCDDAITNLQEIVGKRIQ